MLKATAAFFVRLVERWIPDPYVIAVILTAIVFLLSATVADYGIIETVNAWGDSFWSLLRFTAQIILTLVLGYAVANTEPARRFLESIAGRVNTARGAYMMVCLVGGVTALISWGLSLVAAAVMARKTAQVCRAKGVRIHYPLLVASGYSGFVVWHQGFSGSIPLAINTPDHFLVEKTGLIGISQTILTPWSLTIALIIVITLPFLMARLAPDDAARVIGPFLIQYPLYAGLMGVMAASGLGAMLVEQFVSISSAETLPIWSFFSGAILNIFIPSGGGQWAIQGPIVVDAAISLGADLPRVAMAVALGDQWTNMIQPLFAIPALAIAGLHIRDIMGYCVITLLFTGLVFLTGLMFF